MKNILYGFEKAIFNKTLFFNFTFILSSIATSAVAIDTPTESPQNEQTNVEVIEVEGQRHSSFYRRNLHMAEDAFFSMMNDLVTEDDFKVTCETRRLQAFSRLKGRACEAKFVSRLIGDKTQESFELMSQGKRLRSAFGKEASFNVPTSGELRKKIEKRKKEYLEELVKQINSNPELLQAFNELQIAKQKYEQAKQ